MAFFVASRWAAMSVGAGAVLTILNFEALRRLAIRLVAPGRGKPAIAVVLGLKIAVLFVLLYVLIVKVGLDGMAFGAGASALVVAIVFETIRGSLSSPEPEDA